MHSQIETLFDEAENRYLKPEELALISKFVDSLPARLEAYRTLRDRELEIMQAVADQLQVALPQEKVEHLERSIKNALLLLRYCAMGMLMNDETFVQERLLNWLSSTASIFNTQAIDTVLYKLLNQRLMQVLSPEQIKLLGPQLQKAQLAMQQKAPVAAPS